MATFFLTIRGDQLGTYTSLSGSGNNAGRVVTLGGVEAVGDASETFTVRVDQANTGETEFKNGQLVTILDSAGNVIMQTSSVQPDIEQGLGAGDQHLILSQSNFFIQLAGVPVGPETVLLTNDDQAGITTIGDNDGNLDFSEVVTTFPCFEIGTLIDTPDGPKACETLVAGDQVITENGIKSLIWVGQRTLIYPHGDHPERPVLIGAHTLGSDLPKREVKVSPQHKVLFQGPIVRRLFDCDKVLAPAKGLLALRGVRWMRGMKSTTYVSLLLATHEAIFAEGAMMESLYPGPRAMGALGARLTSEIFEVLPDLFARDVAEVMPPVCRALSVGEAKSLVQEIIKCGQAGQQTNRRAGDPTPVSSQMPHTIHS